MSTLMSDQQDWIAASKEIMDMISNKVPSIKFIDLWAEQTDFDGEEYPFPLPAAFLDIYTSNIDDLGENVQDLNTKVKIYLLYVPTGDTHQNGSGTGDLHAFGSLLRDIYKLFQGTSGENFSQMTREALGREKAAPFEWCYSQTFSCIIRDYAAVKEFADQTLGDLNVLKGGVPLKLQDNMYEPA